MKRSSENNSYIPISRKLFDHAIWKEDREFSKAEAWIDLIAQARYDVNPGKQLIGNKWLTYYRGELIASLRYLATRWGWTKDRVSRFMIFLESEGMISRRTEADQTIINLTNYENFNPLKVLKKQVLSGDGQKTRQIMRHETRQGEHGQNAIQARLSEFDNGDNETVNATDNATDARQLCDKANKDNKVKEYYSFSPDSKTIIYSPFYDLELEKNVNKPEIVKYEAIVKFLFGVDTGQKFEKVLSLKKQISYDNYLKLKETELKMTEKGSKRTLRIVLENMENKKALEKTYESAYLTANNWLKYDG